MSQDQEAALPVPAPERASNGVPSAVAAAIGEEAAAKLAQHFPGAWYYLAVEHYDGPLPGILSEFSRLIGRELTLKLAREFGGRRLYMPASGKGKLRSIIGEEAAQILARHFGNERCEIPLGPLSFTAMRTLRVRSLLVEGLSENEVAKRCGMGIRSVRYQRKLLLDFGVILPHGQTAAGQIVNAKIALMLLDDMRPADIAAHFRVEERHVLARLAELRARKPDLRLSAPPGPATPAATQDDAP